MVAFHSLADVFPLIEGPEFDDLVKDVQEHGLHHPVVIHEGKILDGRNRYRACQALGIPHREIPFKGDDPVAFVISENMRRRHLTPAQLALAGERLATALVGHPVKSPAGPADGEPTAPPTTIDQAARLTGASPTAIKRVRKVRNSGTAAPAVIDAMDAGEITPTAADNLTRRPLAEQEEIMSTVPIGEVPAVAAKALPAEPAGPGRGHVGPKVLMERHMDLPDLALVQSIVKDWGENEAVIPELDADRLAAFVRSLRRSRTATTRLIELIELKTRPAADGPVVDTTLAPVTKKAAARKATARKAPAKKTTAPARKTTARKAPAKETTAAVTGETLAAQAAAVTASRTAGDTNS